MSNLVDTLICENLKALKPYESARRLFSGGQDWLNANESPYSNTYTLDDSRLNRYPDCQPRQVVEGYARYAEVDAAQTLVTRGADEGIELLIRTFCEPGKDQILICPPTYGMYAISAETCNVGIQRVALTEDFRLDLDAMRALVGNVKLVFLCSPNNPTGTLLPSEQIQAVLEMFAGTALVVMDEAYIEFNPQATWAKRLADYPNLVILRTLSKAYALAGLRCGFTLASTDIIQALLKVIAPYPIPEPVAQIAAQALSAEGIALMRTQVSTLNAQRALLADGLAALPDITMVGALTANFVLFRSPLKQALMDYLVGQGVLIRDQSKQLNLENCLRVSVGSPEQNQRLLALMASFYRQQESVS